MQLPKFLVLVTDTDNPDGVEHDVTILHGDQLRAELEAPKHGLTDMSATPMHFTTLWIWASLVRTHVVEDDFRTFKGRLLGIESVDDEPADPTQLEAATS